MLTVITFLTVCFIFAFIGLLTTIGWKYLVAYLVPILVMIGLPFLAYCYERDPEAYVGGINMPFTMLVYSILTVAIICAFIMFSKGQGTQKAQRAAAIQRYRNIDGFYGGEDKYFMHAISICSLPYNAINPMTGKMYTSAEYADPVQVAAWFHEPNKEVYDFENKTNIPYTK